MILIIDNYDSFTYNLVQYVGELEPHLKVVRNDAATPEGLLKLKPTHIIISPGPCTPKEAGISVDLIRQTPASIPLLGVCLGHQCIGAAFGAKIILAPYLMHGKVSTISSMSGTLFSSLPQEFEATRYHSLIVSKNALPEDLKITAETSDGLIMGLEHRHRPIFGLQFHPESILTKLGKLIIKTFLKTGGIT
jgi:anthranilate synthase/aminodeoxychorismate synthase-like glutamine amidotransferase